MHRLGPRPDPPDIIHISSDSEDPRHARGRSTQTHPDRSAGSSQRSTQVSSQPYTQSSSATLVAHQAIAYIDLTRVSSSSPRRPRVSVPALSQEPIPRSRSLETSSSSKSVVRPQWLEGAMVEIEEKFPRAHFTLIAQGMQASDNPENWEIQCDECDEYMVIPAGPGQGLKDLVDHFNEVHPQLRRNLPARIEQVYPEPRLHQNPSKHHELTPARSPATSTPQRTPEPVMPASRMDVNVVKAFLADHGLGPDILPVLQEIGIIDGARIRALGRMSEYGLDRLEQGLSDCGLDLAACLLVREGLRRYAEAE